MDRMWGWSKNKNLRSWSWSPISGLFPTFRILGFKHSALLMWQIVFSKYLLFQNVDNNPSRPRIHTASPYTWVGHCDFPIYWISEIEFLLGYLPLESGLSLLWLLYPPDPANSYASLDIISSGKPHQIFQVRVQFSLLGIWTHWWWNRSYHVSLPVALLDQEHVESWSCMLMASPAASTLPGTGWALKYPSR